MIYIERHDASEKFVLKGTRVEAKTAGNVGIQASKSAVGDLVGYNLSAELEEYTIDIEIKSIEATDYPNSASYTNHNYGFENELRRARAEWGPASSGSMDILYWDGRTIEGILTEVTTAEASSDEERSGQYTATLVWTSLDVYATKQ